MLSKKNLIIFILAFFISPCFTLLAQSAQNDHYVEFFKKHHIDEYFLLNHPLTDDDIKALVTLVAIDESFPGKIASIGYDHDDWYIRLTKDNRILFYSHARFLPLSKAKNYTDYKAYISYQYIPTMPDPKDLSPKRIEQLKKRGQTGSQMRAPTYELSYLDVIYGGSQKATISPYIKRTSFLGFTFYTHELLLEPLKAIEKDLETMAKSKKKIKTFLDSLGSGTSFNWRTILGSKSLSWHSLGIAVDILPEERSKVLYWAWERGRNEDWATVPLADRWMPPDEVIKTFEKYGFIWGGKWLYYDNMHFEYRPELIRIYELNKELQDHRYK